MRIAALRLERYGHLTGETLDFPADHGLHIVLGANEAGKSTALEAVSDGLFGFEHKTTRDFLHPSDTLRVGLTLQRADGTEASFVRRKGRRDTLLDAAGSPLPDAAIAPFLGSATRERFRQVFGLDGAGLRAGGRALLTEQGEAGAAILQAQTGARGLRDVVRRLDDAARSLHGDGRGQRRIAEAARVIRDNRRLMSERSLSGPDWEKAQAALAQLDASLAANQQDAAGLRALQARLERIRRTAPVRRVLAQAARDVAALGPLPLLPEGAARLREAALAAAERARHDLERDQRRRTAIQEQLLDLTPDPAVLDAAEAITALADDRARIAGIRRDWLEQSGVAEQRRADLDHAGTALSLPERGAALQARIPDVVTRQAAERLLAQHSVLSGARAQAAAALDEATHLLQGAARADAAQEPPASDESLRDAVDAARREGRIDDALAEAESAHQAAAERADHLRAGLPLWHGPIEQLLASPVPPEAEVRRLASALEAAGAALLAAEQALATHDRRLAATGAALAGVAAAGPLPTAAAVAEARRIRDQAWQLIRRQFVEGGAPPTPAELEGIGPAETLPARLGQLLRDADGLADRRFSEVVRIGEWERLRAQDVEDRALRDGLARTHAAALAQKSLAEAAWQAAWHPAGVEPLDPAAMRDWTRQRADILAAFADATAARRKRDLLHARHTQLRERLRAALPGACSPAVADLLQGAARRLASFDAAHTAHQHARAAIDAAETQQRKASVQLAGISAKLADWHGEWSLVAPRLGLAAAAAPEDGSVALSLWADIERHARDWADTGRRVAQMASALHAHEDALAALAGRLGLPPAEGLLPLLGIRLSAAQVAHSERSRLHAELAALDASDAARAAELDRAESDLAALRYAAGAADDAGLATAIARADEHSALVAIITQRQDELHRLDDGKSAAELDADAAGRDIDAIPFDLQTTASRLAELDTERTALAGQRADASARLQTMREGQDVAGPALAVQDSLVAIEDAAQRYVRLRLAHALLQGGIERYRRSQQGPLLQQAGALFAQLTEGRYTTLEADEGDRGEPVIFATRHDGPPCKAEFLSEGTRDQLFLALRLASIGIEAASAEPLPLIADDLLVNFDDKRARAALRLLAGFGAVTQVILFTHHAHIAAMADPATTSLHTLPRTPA